MSTSELTAAERQIRRAKELEAERTALMTKIGKNRDYLRLMDSNEELTPDQADWLDTFYPVKEKGEQRTKQEVEATRKAKESAVKEIMDEAKAADKAVKAAPKPSAKPAAAAA